MGRAYSDDLRERVVRAVIKGGLSRHQAAAQFGVGISTAINWVQRFHETGSVPIEPFFAKFKDWLAQSRTTNHRCRLRYCFDLRHRLTGRMLQLLQRRI
jgi:transposase